MSSSGPRSFRINPDWRKRDHFVFWASIVLLPLDALSAFALLLQGQGAAVAAVVELALLALVVAALISGLPLRRARQAAIRAGQDPYRYPPQGFGQQPPYLGGGPQQGVPPGQGGWGQPQGPYPQQGGWGQPEGAPPPQGGWAAPQGQQPYPQQASYPDPNAVEPPKVSLTFMEIVLFIYVGLHIIGLILSLVAAVVGLVLLGLAFVVCSKH